jgi:hypothetical protein
MDVVDQPGPEGQRLGVGVVDTEDAYAFVHPVMQHGPAGLPQRHPIVIVWRPEVDRDDVLVLLGWVLGVTNAAVRPMPEPLGVFAHPWVVGRALQGVVERHLHPLSRGLGAEGSEVVDGPQFGMDGGVATEGRADRPWAAWIVRAGGQGVVAPLASRGANGVDRGEIDHVEPHLGEHTQAFGCPGEASLRPREQLVPRAESRPRSVDPQRQGGRRGQVRVGQRRHEFGDAIVQACVEPRMHMPRRVA